MEIIWKFGPIIKNYLASDRPFKNPSKYFSLNDLWLSLSLISPQLDTWATRRQGGHGEIVMLRACTAGEERNGGLSGADEFKRLLTEDGVGPVGQLHSAAFLSLIRSPATRFRSLTSSRARRVSEVLAGLARSRSRSTAIPSGL
jgi:hypothetical protein